MGANDLTFNIVALGDAFTKIVALGDSVEKLGIRLDELDRKKADPKVSVDTTEANVKLDELNHKLNSTQGLSGGVNNVQTALIGLGVALGSGALSGGALLTLPTVIAAVGVAAVHSNASVQDALSNMTSAAKTSLQQGFAPFVPTLVAIANQGKTAITGLTPAFAEASVAVAPLLQTVSTGLINATKDGVTGAVPLLQQLGPVAQSLADDFGKVQRGVEGFLSNLDVSGAADGLSILGTDLEQILPAVGGLVAEVTPLANAILGDLGPALRNTASDLKVLTPLFNAAGAVISFLGPDISALGPPLLAVMGATKLMTGSWLAFGVAGSKIKPIFTEFGATMDVVRQKLGYTSAATNQATAARAAEAVVTAENTVLEKQLAVATAEAAFTADASEKNALALVAAQEALAASSAAAAKAEAALAATSEAATFSFGPLGIALAGASLLLLPFISGSHTAATSTQDLTTGLVQLGQAVPGAVGGILSGNQSLSDLVNKAGSAGVNVRGLIEAYGKGPGALQSFSDALSRQHDSLGSVTVDIGGARISISALADDIARHGNNLDGLSTQNRALIQEFTAQKDIQSQLGVSIKELTSQQQAEQAATASSANTQGQATSTANALGLSIGMLSQEYKDLATSNKYAMTAGQQMSDTILGQIITVGTANAAITNYFKQADQAATQASQSLVDANHSYRQSITAVADAQHAAVQSDQAVATARAGVVTAERGVADALANEVTAENNVAKAQVARTQAQTNLNVATEQAVEQLKALHLQMADQVTSEESARLALFDQLNASKALGVTPDNASALAATPDDQLTTANEAKVKSAIDLLKAEQALNDTLNTGSNLRDQVTAADKAGVAGSQGVLSAQQALVSAQDQVASSEQALVKSHQAVDDAQANVLKSEQGVTDALYNERKAHQAVSDAVYNQGKSYQALGAAQVALTKAQDDASRSMDISTAAGLRNFGMLKQVADQLYANEPRLQADNDLISNTATVFGISKDAAQQFLDKIGLLTAKQYNIDINAVASADLTQLNSSYSKILAAGHRATSGVGAFAGGGLISGPGTGTSDSIPAVTNTGGLLRVSNDEFIVNAASTRKHLHLLQVINSSKGYASGGLVDPVYESLSMAAFGALYQGGVDSLTALGIPAPPGLPPYVAPAIPNLGGGSLAASSATAAQAQAYAASIFPRFGWGQDQMPYLIKLWNQESGWNPYAVNPSSGAAGIAQSLGHGPVVLGDYKGQIDWGEGYIHGRYITPQGAWAHEVANNWYRDGGPIAALRSPKVRDQGGPIDPGWNMIFNGTGRPETSRSGAQEDALLAELRAMRKDIGKLQSVSVAAPPGSSASEVADMVMRRLRLHGRG